MARRRIIVDKIKEVIRYGVTTELSERAIGRALKVSRTAVTKYLECFRGSGLTWEQAQELPDSELLSVLEGNRPARTSARYERLAERFPMMVKELRRKGVTLQLLWEEYLREHPDGYQNSQFCYHFHRWRKSAEVSMHIDHKAGEKLFVDYAGDRLTIVDPEGGKQQAVETFVAILGASELTYVEASATQQSDDWTRSNERALRYFGGSTQVIIPDNLRSAVSRSDPYEPGINATFDAFAAHYGLVIMPARVRQARDKSLVENAVRLVYQRIYAPLRDRTFHSLDELNAAINPLLEQHNRRRFQRLPYSRRELFEQIERHTLAPLPRHHFPLQQIREVTVQFNYHVELREDRHHYSVPHHLRSRDPRTTVKLQCASIKGRSMRCSTAPSTNSGSSCRIWARYRRWTARSCTPWPTARAAIRCPRIRESKTPTGAATGMPTGASRARARRNTTGSATCCTWWWTPPTNCRWRSRSPRRRPVSSRRRSGCLIRCTSVIPNCWNGAVE